MGVHLMTRRFDRSVLTRIIFEGDIQITQVEKARDADGGTTARAYFVVFDVRGVGYGTCIYKQRPLHRFAHTMMKYINESPDILPFVVKGTVLLDHNDQRGSHHFSGEIWSLEWESTGCSFVGQAISS
jgi:hypothetical protein